MSIQGNMIASNYIVNLVDLQNVITSATGLSQIGQLQFDVNNIQQMVSFDEKRVFTNILSRYDTTPIQVTDDLNLSNASLYQNGILFSGSGTSSSSTIIETQTTISSGGTAIILSNTISTNLTAIDFLIGGSSIMSFNGAGINPLPGTVLTSLNSNGNANWTYISSLTTIDTTVGISSNYLYISGNEYWYIGSGSNFVISNSNNEIATIKSSGFFGISNTNPQATLDVGGNAFIRGNISASNYLSLSDKKFKENIIPLSNSLNIINSLQGVRFQWTNKDNDKNDVGFIAQDVKPYIPEAIYEGIDLEYNISYNKIIPFLVESIKSLDKSVQELQIQISTLLVKG